MDTKVKVKVETTRTGYSAYAEDYPAFTTGGDMAELQENMLKAINLYFDHTGKESVSIDDLDFRVV